MKTFQQLQEGVYDPNIFNAIFLAGGQGGKSYVVRRTTGGLGMKIVNSDDIYEKDLEKLVWILVNQKTSFQMKVKRFVYGQNKNQMQDNLVGLMVD